MAKSRKDLALILLAGTLVVCLVLGEVSVRLLCYSNPSAFWQRTDGAHLGSIGGVEGPEDSKG